MSVNKANVTSYFAVGDLIKDEKGTNSIRITAINDDHVLIQIASSGVNEIQITYDALSGAVSALNKADTESNQPLYRLADAYQERHEDAIDAMWKRAGACQLP